MANRIWMHLIGKPLVETPSNFGFNGMKPSNQKLLDHLAVRFMQHNWGIKAMIREIMMSETYRQSSKYNEANYSVDPDNKFLWRANPRHMDAESLRDSMLAVAGKLNRQPPQKDLAVGTRSGQRGQRETRSAEDTHRSVYLPIDRSLLPPALELFGFPDPNSTSPGRSESIVPTQALYLMNDVFVVSQAQAMAEMLEKRFDSRQEQVQMAILWAYGRPASQQEIQASEQFFKEFASTGSTSNANGEAKSREPNANEQRSRGGGKRARAGGRERSQSGAAGPVAGSQTPLSVFCQTLMASASFRVLD